MFMLERRDPWREWRPATPGAWLDRNLLRSTDIAGGLWTSDYGAADLFETDDAVIVQMLLPGFKPEDISVQEQQGMLTVRANQRVERRAMHDGVEFEAQHAHFAQRSFRLPAHVDAGQATATLQDGVLTITLPKAHSSRAHRITIQASGHASHGRSWLDRVTSWFRRPRARLTLRAA